MANVTYCPLFGVGVGVGSGEGVPKSVGVAKGAASGVGVPTGVGIPKGGGATKGKGAAKGEGVAKGEGAVSGADSNLPLLISYPSAIGPKARTGKNVSAPRMIITPAVTVVNKTESVLRVPVVSGTCCLLVMLSAKSSRATIGT